MNRRQFLSVAAVGSATAVAGCAEADEPSRQEKISESVEYDCKVAQPLGVGESVGVRDYSEQWRVKVTDVRDGEIDIKAVKTLLDGEGQDREGINGRITFERGDIKRGNRALVEGDFVVWYVDDEDGKPVVAVGVTDSCGDI